MSVNQPTVADRIKMAGVAVSTRATAALAAPHF